MKIKSLTGGELVLRAIEGKDVTLEETLALYADRRNWRQEYDGTKCIWVWRGPVICGYEAAERAILKDREEKKK